MTYKQNVIGQFRIQAQIHFYSDADARNAAGLVNGSKERVDTVKVKEYDGFHTLSFNANFETENKMKSFLEEFNNKIGPRAICFSGVIHQVSTFFNMDYSSKLLTSVQGN